MYAALIIAIAALGSDTDDTARVRPLFEAIRHVESGGDPAAVGDDGRSIGPYQIQLPYWRDSGIPGRYHQVRDQRYAERVMLAYWRRYCPRALQAGDYQTLARVHNGGLSGNRRTTTIVYWRKIRAALRR